MKFTFRYGEQVYTIDLEPQTNGKVKARIGEKEFEIIPMTDQSGGITFQLADRRVQTYSAVLRRESGQPETHVMIDDDSSRLFELVQVTGQSERNRSGARQSGSLNAQMPGQVTQILVQQGERVTQGQTVLILEAMKMETRLTAPAEGVVARLLVEKGQTVERGQLLIEIQSDS